MNAATAWKFTDGVLLSALLALAVAVGWAPWNDVAFLAWNVEEQSHILLGLPVALWLGWTRRDRLRYAPPRRTLVGPLVCLAGWGISRWGYLNGTELAWHGGALLIVFGAVLTVVGFAFVRQFLPAFCGLIFLLPVPGRIRHMIALPLQEISARISEFFLMLFNVPVERAGNVLTIAGHEVAIAEACNGMRMVAALGLVAFAFIYTVPMRSSVRILILCLSPLIALLVNVIRLVPTALLYGYADKSTADIFHDLSGWGVLVIALGMLWGFLGLLRWIEVPIAPYAVAEE
ncbi:MAG TPA: exosortase/archaeosortase family protein [Phycisphaerales bacterium]|nr:exosortase/archaeosortase family protein [Phycisphaerales bacterium]